MDNFQKLRSFNVTNLTVQKTEKIFKLSWGSPIFLQSASDMYEVLGLIDEPWAGEVKKRFSAYLKTEH